MTIAPLFRALRPGLQVPLANACASTGVAALVMHFGRTSELRAEAFTLGLTVAACGSLVLMRVIFTGTNDPTRARTHALLWPPLLGASLGALCDWSIQASGYDLKLSFAGSPLGGGLGETLQIAAFSALAGLLGTALLLPQIRVLGRARASSASEGGANPALAALAERLGLLTWAVALAIGVLASVLAGSREVEGAVVLAVVGATGLAGQVLRAFWGRSREVVTTPAPYR